MKVVYRSRTVSYTHLDVYKRQVPLIGYRSDYVYYDRHERFAGESKYPLKKMISFALDGITSFSVKPLKLISNLGILISILSVFGLLYALISYCFGVTVSGWTAIVCSIWLLGGLQMLCLGVVGGYIGKIYSEVKARPRFRVCPLYTSQLPSALGADARHSGDTVGRVPLDGLQVDHLAGGHPVVLLDLCHVVQGHLGLRCV